MNAIDRPVGPGVEVEDHKHSRPHGSRTIAVIVIVLGGFTKASAVSTLVRHPATLCVVAGLVAVLALLRGRPLGAAVAGALIVPVAIQPASVLVGVAIGVGTLLVLVTLFVLIGTVLRATEGAPA